MAGQVTYSLVVVNSGLETAQNVHLTDQLPAGTTFVSVTPKSPACTMTSGVLGCSLGTMASGAQQTLTLVVTVCPGLAGTTLTAALTSPTVTTTAGTCAIASGTLSCPLGALAGGGTVTVTVTGTLAASTSAASISNTASASSSTDDLNPANNTATVVTAVTPLAGCSAAGSVYASQDFAQVVGHKTRIVHVQATGDCDLDRRTGKIFLHHASLRVQIDRQAVLIDAKQDTRHNDITRVQFTSARDVVISGAWAGTPFTVTIHDGYFFDRNDTVRVEYGSFDTSTLAAGHGQVRIGL